MNSVDRILNLYMTKKAGLFKIKAPIHCNYENMESYEKYKKQADEAIEIFKKEGLNRSKLNRAVCLFLSVISNDSGLGRKTKEIADVVVDAAKNSYFTVMYDDSSLKLKPWTRESNELERIQTEQNIIFDKVIKDYPDKYIKMIEKEYSDEENEEYLDDILADSSPRYLYSMLCFQYVKKYHPYLEQKKFSHNSLISVISEKGEDDFNKFMEKSINSIKSKKLHDVLSGRDTVPETAEHDMTQTVKRAYLKLVSDTFG